MAGLVGSAYTVAVYGLALIVVVGILSLFFEWFDRKAFARLQNRYGPLHTGPSGLLQPLADFIKLLSKEDITPEAADKLLFALSPVVICTIPLLTLFFIPVFSKEAIVFFEGDLIFALFLATLLYLFVFIAAWSSTNPFSIVGGVRAALQLMSYEIPLALALIVPAMFAKSLSITTIAKWFETSFQPYALVPLALAFFIAVVCAQAELERVPFDIPEAESEIVAGWQTEFSGRKLALLRLASDIELVLMAALIATLFFGGAAGPWLPPFAWFLIKTTIVVFVFANIRALFARFRIDQLLRGAWGILLPLSMLNVFVAYVLMQMM